MLRELIFIFHLFFTMEILSQAMKKMSCIILEHYTYCCIEIWHLPCRKKPITDIIVLDKNKSPLNRPNKNVQTRRIGIVNM